MPSTDGLRKYLEAGAALGQITRARAEEIVRELVNAGDLQRGQAQEWIDDLVERSRKASEDMVALVRSEVANQLDALGIDPDDLARQVADILKRSAQVGRMASSAAAAAAGAYRRPSPSREAARPAAGEHAERGPAKKAPTKKVPTKKAASAKKSATKKATAKKSTTKKVASANKAPGKKSATKKAPAKKSAPAKKATAKNTSAKKAAPAKRASKAAR